MPDTPPRAPSGTQHRCLVSPGRVPLFRASETNNGRPEGSRQKRIWPPASRPASRPAKAAPGPNQAFVRALRGHDRPGRWRRAPDCSSPHLTSAAVIGRLSGRYRPRPGGHNLTDPPEGYGRAAGRRRRGDKGNDMRMIYGECCSRDQRTSDVTHALQPSGHHPSLNASAQGEEELVVKGKSQTG